MEFNNIYTFSSILYHPANIYILKVISFLMIPIFFQLNLTFKHTQQLFNVPIAAAFRYTIKR